MLRILWSPLSVFLPDEGDHGIMKHWRIRDLWTVGSPTWKFNKSTIYPIYYYSARTYIAIAILSKHLQPQLCKAGFSSWWSGSTTKVIKIDYCILCSLLGEVNDIPRLLDACITPTVSAYNFNNACLFGFSGCRETISVARSMATAKPAFSTSVMHMHNINLIVPMDSYDLSNEHTLQLAAQSPSQKKYNQMFCKQWEDQILWLSKFIGKVHWSDTRLRIGTQRTSC